LSKAAYIGLMSGTSMDGIDAVLAVFEPSPRIIHSSQHPWPVPLLEELQAAASGASVTPADLARLDSAAGEAFAAAAQAVAHDYTGQIYAIGSHGQTLAHGPEQDPAFTLQIGNPAIIAERTGITTVADFRRRDLAAGGQGAPLVPAFHAATLGSRQENRIILNIGGIANITVLPADPDLPVSGFDTGPGNCLLDSWIRLQKGVPFDKEGLFAASGTIQTGILAQLLEDPYFDRVAPKSTGTDYFSPAWLEGRPDAPITKPEDIQATLVALTAQSIADAIAQLSPAGERVLVCGGGAHNPTIMAALRERIPCPVESTASVGMDPDWVEALAFAWLARQTLHGRPGNLPAVTGARHPVILGAIYPANPD